MSDQVKDDPKFLADYHDACNRYNRAAAEPPFTMALREHIVRQYFYPVLSEDLNRNLDAWFAAYKRGELAEATLIADIEWVIFDDY